MSFFKKLFKKGTLFLVPISIFLVYENTKALTNVSASDLNSNVELQINNSAKSADLITDTLEFSGDSLKPLRSIDYGKGDNAAKKSKGVICHDDHISDNGEFVFDLNGDYEQITIDTDLFVRGQYDFFSTKRGLLSNTITGEGRETLFNSGEIFSLDGIVKRGQTIELGSSNVWVIKDIHWGDDIFQEKVTWSGTLSEDGTQFTLFVSDSRNIDKIGGTTAFPFYGIYQIYSNLANESEYHNETDNWGSSDTETPKYNANGKLKFDAERSGFNFDDTYIDIEDTNDSIYRLGKEDDMNLVGIENLSMPFFTRSNTYKDVEEILLDKNLIIVRDSDNDKQINLPNDYVNIIFYDENGSVINKSSNLTTNEINIDIVGKEGTQDYIIGEINDETLNIPFVPVELHSDTNNIYDFSYEDESDPTDNITTTNWVMENGKWTLKTNSPFELSLLGDDFKSFTIGNSEEYLINGQDINLKPYQVIEGQSNEIDSNIKLKSKNDYEWIFNYDFDVEDENGDIKVKTPAQMSNGMLLNEDEGIFNQDIKKVFDMNGNSQIESNEIYSTSQVFTDFYVEHDSENDFVGYEWSNDNEIWEKKSNQVELIQNPGIYGFSSIDEYGNNTFELVEYLDTNDSKSGLSSSELQNWEGTLEYEEDLKIARDQGVISNDADADEFNNVRAHELRKINDQSSENMIDLDKVVVDNELLQNITASYASDNFKFRIQKEELEDEIERQLQKSYGINPEDIKIAWNKDEDEIVTIGEKLTYSITPGQTWLTKNEYGFGVEDSTFEVASYVDLSLWEGIIDDQKLSDVTNSFEQGETFKDVRKKLEIAIKDDLKAKVNNTDALDFKWNIRDEESIYYDTEINFSITSKADNILGTLNGTFESETYFDLKHIDIDKVPLQEITLDYVGKEFGEYRVKLEEEINNQITSQGYPKDYIQINWNNFDSEVLTKGENIDFSLSSKNERIVHNEYDRTFDFGIPPAHKNSKKTNIIIYSSIFSLVILMILIFIFIAYRKKAKYRKELKRRTERNRELIKNNEFIQRTLRDKEAEKKDK